MRAWLLVLLFVSATRAQDLKIYPYFGEPPGPYFDEARHLDHAFVVWLVLFNDSPSPMTVLTQGGLASGYEPNLAQGKDRPRFILSFDTAHGISGRTVVPSLPALAPVELQPGELTEIQLYINAPRKNFDYRSAVFEYSVDEDLGRRFKIWSGTVKSQMYRQRARRLNDNRLP